MTGGASDRGVLERFAKDLLRERRLLLVVLAAIAGSSIATVAAPLVLRRVIDQYVVPGRWEGLPRAVLLYLAALTAQWGFMAARHYSISVFGQRFLMDMRRRILDRVLRADPRWLQARSTGDLVSRIVNDTSHVNDVLVAGLLGGLGDLASLIGIVAAMILLDWRLSIAALSSLPLMLLVARFYGGRLRRAYRETRARLAELSHRVEEAVAGMEQLRGASGEPLYRRLARDAALRVYKSYLLVALYMGAFWPLMTLSARLGMALTIAWGAVLVERGAATIGVVVAFIQYVQRFMGPINNVVSMYDSLQSALAGLERIYDALDAPPEPEGGEPVEKLRGHIEYRNVWFSYEPGRPVLRGVSLEARPGETVAIVGPTGGGKTTLVRLLLRFHDPDRGELLVDGRSTRGLERRSLRRRISLVPQETYLFPGTILENIAAARPGATRREVEEVVRELGLEPIIRRLPRGLDTPAGEAGRRLSRGERQLISIARALIRRPDIVVLDEAMSSVDPGTERLVRRAMKRLLEGRTSIIVAHRLDAAREADRIVVVAGGRIVEEGSWSELLEKRGFFYRLYRRQAPRLGPLGLDAEAEPPPEPERLNP